MFMRFTVYSMVLLLFVSASVVIASEAGILRSQATLYAESSSKSDKLQSLEHSSEVEILDRKGGWYNVRLTDGSTGWVRLSRVKRSSSSVAANRKAASSNIDQLMDDALLSGRLGSNEVTPATGIRGLDKENIENAAPDAGAVDQLDAQAVDDADAMNFAEQGGLRSRNIEYLDGNDSSESNGSSDRSSSSGFNFGDY